MLTKEAKAARNAYRKEWAKRNPDKVRAANERYWQKKAEELTQAAENNENEQNS